MRNRRPASPWARSAEYGRQAADAARSAAAAWDRALPVAPSLSARADAAVAEFLSVRAEVGSTEAEDPAWAAVCELRVATWAALAAAPADADVAADAVVRALEAPRPEETRLFTRSAWTKAVDEARAAVLRARQRAGALTLAADSPDDLRARAVRAAEAAEAVARRAAEAAREAWGLVEALSG